MSAVAVAPRTAFAYRRLNRIDPSQAAGLRQLRRARQTGRLVGVYEARSAGIEEDGWASVCEEHATLVLHDTRALAESHAADPMGWCEPCREPAR